MRVVITGATGFLGSHLARALVKSGIGVAVLKRRTSRLDRLSDMADRLEFHTISREGMTALFDGAKHCDAIIHAATCYGRRNERWTALNDANVSFPLSLLEISIKRGIAIFLNIDTALDATVSAYALSKGQFADWGRMAATQNDSFSFINARVEHFYGAGNNQENFVTSLIRQCLANSPRIPLTGGAQTRDFIHVDDVVSGITHLLHAAQRGRIPRGASEFDIGSGHAITIRSLAKLVQRLCNSRARLDFGAVPYRANECMVSSPDTEPLKSLGWACRIGLEEGLMATIDAERHR